jgi:aryl-alcohol dehydrogenase-like predicted oxidoreductase
MMMTELTDLSRIGFGCYRVTVGSPAHRDALRHALGQGCNLIDTAATYSDGDSECLVGQVLSERPRGCAFVITKIGYIHGKALRVIAGLREKGLAESGVDQLSDAFMHSIHPDYLWCQLEVSLGRLGRGWVDGLLLHNPERAFGRIGGLCRDEYYDRIGMAFEFLEEMVAEGKIRYYGVSSNSLPAPPDAPDGTDLGRLVRIARGVANDHHFKLIQFPINLLETAAVEKCDRGRSLVDLAKEYGVIALGNRPLNATSPDGFVRLASCDGSAAADAGDAALFSECLRLIRARLLRAGLPGDPNEIGILKYLADHWTTLGSPEAVTQVFDDYFFPLLDKLYGGHIPANDRAVYQAVYDRAHAFGRGHLAAKTRRIRSHLIREKKISDSDDRSLQYIACECYLNWGVDHVLVGMRDVKYVDNLKGLFRWTPWGCSGIERHAAPALGG